MTWNILGAHDPDLTAVAHAISEREPDVVALQEVRRSQARRLARHLGWRHVWTRKHYPYSPLVWWRAEGLAVLSPWALSGRMRTTISPGVSTWIYKHRVLLAATATRREGALRLFVAHLASHDADERIAQARRVADHVRADTAALRVVAGDLNTVTPKGSDDTEIEVLREFRTVGLFDHGGTVTNPSIAPNQRLDYVLVPEVAHVLCTDTPTGGDTWNQLSDHLPVVVEFEVP
jgi:endonuclease/exonuclease/phosphatase family metal-dependent hydrolase